MSNESVVAFSLARRLEEARSLLSKRWTTGSCDAAFARWATRLATTHETLLPPLEPVDMGATLRHGEAPVLARIGYAIATDPNSEQRQPFMDGSKRLMARDPYPLDRNTFLYRPVELLGISLGARAVSNDWPDLQRWLRETLADNRRQQTTAVQQLAQTQVRLAEHYAGIGTVVSKPAAIDLVGYAVEVWGHLAELDDVWNAPPRPEAAQDLLRAAGTAPLPESVGELAIIAATLETAIDAQFGRLQLTSRPFVDTVVDICRRFPTVVDALKRRHAQRPTLDIDDEYDVQDLLTALLHVIADDIRPEEWNPSYAGKSSRADILLKTQQVVVEVKMTRKGLADRGVMEELTIDKAQYRTHPDCQTLVCFVYDPHRHIVNPAAIENDLSEPNGTPRTFVVISR